MNRTEKLAELRSLQARADAIREELEFSPPGKIVFLAHLDVSTDNTLLVEADRFGGATASVVEGNYPVDYVTKFERFFPNNTRLSIQHEFSNSV